MKEGVQGEVKKVEKMLVAQKAGKVEKMVGDHKAEKVEKMVAVQRLGEEKLAQKF